MKKLAFVLLLLIPLLSYSQKKLGYIIKNRTYAESETVDNGEVKNSQKCHYIFDEEDYFYSPNEISEYKLPNGKIFVSKEINIENGVKRVFLEKVVNGKLSFFYYGGKSMYKFYIEKDKKLIQLNEISALGTFKQALISVTSDNINSKNIAKNVTYNKKSIAMFAKIYNSGKKVNLQTFKIGVNGGLKLVNHKFHLSTYSKSAKYLLKGFQNFDQTYAANLGLFGEFPLNLYSSLYTELNVSKVKNSIKEKVRANDLIIMHDITFDYLSVDIPIMYKYTLLQNKYRPYFGVGLHYTKLLEW